MKRNKASKLKTEESTKVNLGKKLRQKKADTKLSKKELAKKACIRRQSIAAIRNVGALSDTDKRENDFTNESVAEDAISETGHIIGTSIATSSKLKNAKYSNMAHSKKPGVKQEDTAKNRIKKQMQKKAAETQRKASENAGKIGRKLTDKAEDLVGKIGELIVEYVIDNPLISILIVVLLIVTIIFSSLLTSCSACFSAGNSITIATTYTAKDQVILDVNSDYKELEAEIKQQIDDTESDYPGYDEYRYYLDEIGHNPYQLAAILTVIYEDYTRQEVQEKLKEILDKQYEITTEEIVETRYRQEEKTGYRWVEDASLSAGGYYEAYTYTETVSYQYYILNITLKNHTLDEVVTELGLDEDQLERYQILLMTYGNKKYLFEDDIYSISDAGDYEDYDIPGEYLTNEQFNNMMREAEKYLGRAYIWGGSTPETGFDCSGFVSWVINHCGNGWNLGRQTAEGLRKSTSRVAEGDVKPGDLIFFKGTYDTSGASHVGIVVDPVNHIMIHCGNPIQYASYDTNYWKKHFYCYGRIH